MRLRSVLGLILAGVTALSLVVSEPAGADTGGDEMDFAARVNQLRSAKGLASLAVKGELSDVARAWSSRLAGGGALSHNPSLSSQVPSNWRRVAENVGVGADVAQVFDALAASPVHYNNMVDGGFDSLGVGVMRAGDGRLFATMTFMATVSTESAAAPARPATVRKVVRACTRSRRGRMVCLRRVHMVPA